jgi:hypothetical protein
MKKINTVAFVVFSSAYNVLADTIQKPNNRQFREIEKRKYVVQPQ